MIPAGSVSEILKQITLLFAHAPGLLHSSASWLAGSDVSVGAAP